MVDDLPPGYLDLYHRTSPEAADAIMRTRSMNSKENTAEVYCSTRPDRQTGEYGQAVVQLRVPQELAELEDEFPDGEQHYRVPMAALRPEHFITTWTETPAATHDELDNAARVATGTSSSITRGGGDYSRTVPQIGNPPSPDVTTRDASALAIEPAPPQVDLDLGEAVYRRATERGGFTPESVAAAEVTIEQAVTARQEPSTAQRLHALADRVDAARAARTTAPPPASPPPPSTAADVARQRAVAAQIWNDTSIEHDPPARAQRR